MHGMEERGKPDRNYGSQVGLSLVEVLVSLSITLLLGGVILNVFSAGLENASAARARAAADIYAASILEACQARPTGWDWNSVTGVGLAPEQLGLSVPAPQGFTAQVRVESYGCNGQVYRVDTTIYWTEEGRPCQETLTGLVRSGTV